MTMQRTIAVLAAAAAVSLAGCDFFSPRVAERPVDSSSVCRTNRQDPLDLFTDMKCALDARANGEPVYEDILDEGYVFIMDPQEAVSIGPPGSWNKQTDVNFLQSANAKLDSVRINFTNQLEGGTGQDAALSDTSHWTADYRIVTRGTGIADSVEYAGSADVTFRRGLGADTWVIYRWVDHKVGGFRTIGVQRRS